jgi:hypothetical protein
MPINPTLRGIDAMVIQGHSSPSLVKQEGKMKVTILQKNSQGIL